jgi:hypothetical protein
MKTAEQELNEAISDVSQQSEAKLTLISELNKDLKRVMAEINTSALQLSVLKLQLNPNLKIGF